MRVFKFCVSFCLRRMPCSALQYLRGVSMHLFWASTVILQLSGVWDEKGCGYWALDIVCLQRWMKEVHCLIVYISVIG